MKWKSDWLHRLVYCEIESIWKRATKDGVGAFGPPPDYLLVSQFSKISVFPCEEAATTALNAALAGPELQQWLFDDSGLRVKVESSTAFNEANDERGMFYRIGTVGFHISADREMVVLHYTVGPRYGENRVFRVDGQGDRGRLLPHPDYVWSRS